MNRSLFDLARKMTLEKASREFRDFREAHAYTAARRLMDETFADLPDVDHSFVREFQTAGFSARVLELTLFAALREQGKELDRTSPAPDFVVSGDAPVAIEATTTNPPQGETAENVDIASAVRRLIPDDLEAAEAEFVFQIGKALRRKLEHRDAQGRAYWEKPHVEGVPFVLAVQSFHNPSALFHTTSPLATYLYGIRSIPTRDRHGSLVVNPQVVREHRRKDKSIPSGLFAQPEAEHLAAVIFTNSATVSKWTRIGTERGYGPADVAVARCGAMYDPDPDAALPVPFGYVVGDYGPEEHETFSEGFHVLHNPWTRTPVAAGTLDGFTDHRLQPDGTLLTTVRHPDYFVSRTMIIQGAKALPTARLRVQQYLAGEAGRR
ncbi:hypothetical protein QFZ22_000675 [Streptomyces canus]|uniref:Glycosaminoglycan attachment site n=1 Tax=Streptomyces canus TaxID=58343 RepID=A0AAW8F610_9ACTN|nr:hypothetical protein [Streptomyces canus]MDQ0904690.1 hypothetical protein [Streptomyces canus]